MFKKQLISTNSYKAKKICIARSVARCARTSAVALRPPPAADEGSKSALQNKELKECAPSTPHNDYILVRTSFKSCHSTRQKKKARNEPFSFGRGDIRSTLGNALPRLLRCVSKLEVSSTRRAKNSPQDCFLNALFKSCHLISTQKKTPKGLFLWSR